MTWNFDTLKEALSEMEKVDYQEFIKAFLSLELSISDRTILDQVYQDYMDEDDLSLISDELRVKVDSYQDEVQADMTDILEKLYRTGLFWRFGSPCLAKRFTRPEKSFLTTLCGNCNGRYSTRKRPTSLGPRLTQRAEKHSRPF